MSVTTQQNTLDAATVPPPADFGDVRAEFQALVAAAGVYELSARAKVSLTGSDRVRWLNGMVTNNIRDLAPGHGVYAFLLNPQGHILGDLYAYNRGESLLVDTDRSQLEKILAVFDKYIIMDDVEVARREAGRHRNRRTKVPGNAAGSRVRSARPRAFAICRSDLAANLL